MAALSPSPSALPGRSRALQGHGGTSRPGLGSLHRLAISAGCPVAKVTPKEHGPRRPRWTRWQEVAS